MYSFDSNNTLIPILENIDADIVSNIRGCIDSDVKLIEDANSTQNTFLVYLLALLCSAVIGLSGILPLIFTMENSRPAEKSIDDFEEQEDRNLSCQKNNNILDTSYKTIKEESTSSRNVPFNTSPQITISECICNPT